MADTPKALDAIVDMVLRYKPKPVSKAGKKRRRKARKLECTCIVNSHTDRPAAEARRDRMRRVVVGFSGGVTSAWCAGWALRNFPREEVILLWHDTKEEHPDTIRFLREMAAALGLPITERSDGRSVTEVFRDEGFLGNNQNAMCSRILKQEPGDAFLAELRASGVTEIVKVLGFSAREAPRVQRATMRAERDGYTVRFPMVEEKATKQMAVDFCQKEMKV
jgi:3'-phosphoadenosine 5'-phosphosulfate sulfotransferase (PAPS reductase)/FAD synthetase